MAACQRKSCNLSLDKLTEQRMKDNRRKPQAHTCHAVEKKNNVGDWRMVSAICHVQVHFERWYSAVSTLHCTHDRSWQRVFPPHHEWAKQAYGLVTNRTKFCILHFTRHSTTVFCSFHSADYFPQSIFCKIPILQKRGPLQYMFMWCV